MLIRHDFPQPPEYECGSLAIKGVRLVVKRIDGRGGIFEPKGSRESGLSESKNGPVCWFQAPVQFSQYRWLEPGGVISSKSVRQLS